MPVARAHPTAAEDTNRPHFHYVHKPADVPAPATAIPPPSPEYCAAAAAQATRPPVISEQALHSMCFAYAHLSPSCRKPGAVAVQTIVAAAPGLLGRFALIPSARANMGLRFHCPAGREAAMRLQPFTHAGATVTLARAWETSILDDYFVHNMPQHLVRSTGDLLVHAVLQNYPAEQRTEMEIGANCRGFGWVLEVDQACFDAPDLASVPVVLCVGHPSKIPRELRIVYADGSTSVVPVQILGVCSWTAAFRAHGRYVRFFQPLAAAAPTDFQCMP